MTWSHRAWAVMTLNWLIVVSQMYKPMLVNILIFPEGCIASQWTCQYVSLFLFIFFSIPWLDRLYFSHLFPFMLCFLSFARGELATPLPSTHSWLCHTRLWREMRMIMILEVTHHSVQRSESSKVSHQSWGYQNIACQVYVQFPKFSRRFAPSVNGQIIQLLGLNTFHESLWVYNAWHPITYEYKKSEKGCHKNRCLLQSFSCEASHNTAIIRENFLWILCTCCIWSHHSLHI